MSESQTRYEDYLLGRLSESDAAQLESDIFGENRSFVELQSTESRLIEQYVAGQLPLAEEKLFERHYLVTPERRARVCEVAENILGAEINAELDEAHEAEDFRLIAGLTPAKPAPPPYASRPKNGPRVLAIVMRHPLVAGAIAAGLVCALALGIWLMMSKRPTPEVVHQNPPPPPPVLVPPTAVPRITLLPVARDTNLMPPNSGSTTLSGAQESLPHFKERRAEYDGASHLLTIQAGRAAGFVKGWTYDVSTPDGRPVGRALVIRVVNNSNQTFSEAKLVTFHGTKASPDLYVQYPLWQPLLKVQEAKRRNNGREIVKSLTEFLTQSKSLRARSDVTDIERGVLDRWIHAATSELTVVGSQN